MAKHHPLTNGLGADKANGTKERTFDMATEEGIQQRIDALAELIPPRKEPYFATLREQNAVELDAEPRSGIWDCMVIGGGPAGLAAAQVFKQSRAYVIVFDDLQYRDRKCEELHNVPGCKTRKEWRNAATHFLWYRQWAVARIQHEGVVKIRKASPHVFEATTKDGDTFKSFKVILATGVMDCSYDIGLYERLFAVSIFPKIDYIPNPSIGHPVGIIGVHEFAKPKACRDAVLALFRFSTQITLYTNGKPELGRKVLELTKDIHAVNIHDGKLTKFVKRQNGTWLDLHFEDGTKETECYLYCPSPEEPRNDLAKQLGVNMDPQGYIKTGAKLATNVHGVFAAGDCVQGECKDYVGAMARGHAAGQGAMDEILELAVEMTQKPRVSE